MFCARQSLEVAPSADALRLSVRVGVQIPLAALLTYFVARKQIAPAAVPDFWLASLIVIGVLASYHSYCQRFLLDTKRVVVLWSGTLAAFVGTVFLVDRLLKPPETIVQLPQPFGQVADGLLVMTVLLGPASVLAGLAAYFVLRSRRNTERVSESRVDRTSA